ncbi:AAA-like domain-containing protein [Natronorubrum sediminis]|uniref:AAA-like domain-containing protein n=1 Tax=Natronorubrum sediminis TaxID=640943 RepID=A0A1H6FYV2_9EURY|nr:DUF87 domain-containing protein [Natronorubrum sediminis]SEH14964.1 AAA-like domain-containing protein [Natronorubrum sediminis]
MPDSVEQLAVSTDDFAFPAEEILTGRGFITGKSGSGKSNTASVVVEELLDRNLPLLLVDTDGEYVDLQETYENLMHVGGADRCDLQIDSESADKLTSYALEEHVPIVLDVSTYHDEEETAAVLEATVEALFIAEHEYRIPFLLLLEEAHEFIPQQGGTGGSDLKSLLIRVAKRGRKRGLGICALSQRPAAVDKDFITQCNWFVWHRLTWENDTTVVSRIIGTESAETVQTLDDGEALVQTDWAESVDRVQFRLRRTDDVGSTPSLEDLDRTRRTDQPNDVNDPDSMAASGDSADSSSGSSGQSTSSQSSSQSASSKSSSQSALSTSRRANRPGASASKTDVSGGFGANTVERTEIRYDESATSASSLSVPDQKPSLERRLDRHNPPENTAEPLWELGAMVVYLYDLLVWYHLSAISILEARYARSIRRLKTALVSRHYASRPRRYERYLYRLGALLTVLLCYGLLISSVLVLV